MVTARRPGVALTLLAFASAAKEWCRPGAACWPSAEELRGLCVTGSCCRVLLPSDAGFEAAAVLRDTAWTYAPGAIVKAATADDVARAVAFAAARGIEPRVFSTGRLQRRGVILQIPQTDIHRQGH